MWQVRDTNPNILLLQSLQSTVSSIVHSKIIAGQVLTIFFKFLV